MESKVIDGPDKHKVVDVMDDLAIAFACIFFVRLDCKSWLYKDPSNLAHPGR